MLRFFSGVGHFFEGAHGLMVSSRGLRVSYSLLPIMVLLAGIGCSSQPYRIAEQNQALKENASLVCTTSLSAAASPAAIPPANLPTDTAQPNVSRLQKPENDPPKRSSSRSILDLAAYPAPTPSNGEVTANIRAIVNGEAILDEEVRETIYPELLRMQSFPEPDRSIRRKELFENGLQSLIEREVILQDMFTRLNQRKQVLEKLKEAAGKEFDKKMRETRKAMNIKTDEEMKAFLRSQGVSLAGVRRQIERRFMAMEYMRNRIVPAIERIGHEHIREYYEHHPEEFQVPDSVSWQDIFLDAARYPNREAARQLAVQLISRARAGEDFRQLVTQYDQGNSSYLNGEGYGHRRGEIKPLEAEPILFQMREGALELMELTNGFHVIHLVKRQYAGLKPFDEKTQTAIRNKLQNEAWEREYKRILKDLKAKATIEISANPQ